MTHTHGLLFMLVKQFLAFANLTCNPNVTSLRANCCLTDIFSSYQWPIFAAGNEKIISVWVFD